MLIGLGALRPRAAKDAQSLGKTVPAIPIKRTGTVVAVTLFLLWLGRHARPI
jgi:hypothetical protein